MQKIIRDILFALKLVRCVYIMVICGMDQVIIKQKKIEFRYQFILWMENHNFIKKLRVRTLIIINLLDLQKCSRTFSQLLGPNQKKRNILSKNI